MLQSANNHVIVATSYQTHAVALGLIACLSMIVSHLVSFVCAISQLVANAGIACSRDWCFWI